MSGETTVEFRGGVTATGNIAKSGGAFYVARLVSCVPQLHRDSRMTVFTRLVQASGSSWCCVLRHAFGSLRCLWTSLYLDIS